MKRVWKPLDVGGMRLYVVWMRFHNHPQWNRDQVVIARSPTDAKQLVEDQYAGAIWEEEPVFIGHALNVLMPESWWRQGIPTVDDTDG